MGQRLQSSQSRVYSPDFSWAAAPSAHQIHFWVLEQHFSSVSKGNAQEFSHFTNPLSAIWVGASCQTIENTRVGTDQGELGLDTDPALSVWGTNLSSGAPEAPAHLLELDHPPTAIITSNSLLALSALITLRRRGLRYGHDVEVLSYDAQEWMPLVEQPMTVIGHDPPRWVRSGVA